MTYKAVRITELMAHEFAQVEGALDSLDKKALKAAIPANFSVDQFIEQVEQGHWLLLNDSPVTPMLIKESNEMGNAAWVINNQTIDHLEPAAQKALLARTNMSGAVSGATQSRNLHPPLPMAPYIPEPAKPSDSDKPLPLKYEYCFEIACSDESFRHRVCCSFVLAKTKNEAMLGRWTESKTEHGTRYTVLTAVDEPKRLVAEIASYPMGISLEEPVKVKPIGTQTAYEGFIPVCPAVQLGERLGLPTEGYFYHFHDGKLIQEYKLLGDKKWSFYGTRSTSERLDDTQAYNMYQNALLVYWKIGGKIVENQYLVYLEQQIARDVLDNLNDEWLSQHGVKLTIPALLEAAKQPVIAREDKSQTEEPQENRASYGLPPAAPDAFNHPLNAFYDYSERFLVDTNVKAINVNHSLVPDIPLVNLKTISESATEFDLGFTQVEQTQDLDTYWETLFSSETSEQHRAVIKKYNTHLNDPVRQGEIVILPTMEPKNASQQEKLDALIEEAQAASVELAKLTEDQVATVNRHFELLDYYADETMKKIDSDGLPGDLYAYASMGVGAIAAGVQQHLKNINGVLLEINHLYVAQVAMASRTGGINYGSFVSERANLFKKLDGSFAALSKRSVQLPIYTQIKRNLKLSTRSIIHNADEIIAKGFVPNLGKRMANVAIGIAASRGVGYVGLILGGASGAKNMYEACSVDGSGECGKVTTREVAGFIGGTYLGSKLGALAVGTTILLLGTASAPVVAIASVGAFVAGGAIGGIVGTTAGKKAGDIAYSVYEWIME
ncbi:hypothetical protein [Vibrio sp. 11986-1-5]|uniref:hypothetical protein n=1 Tax=Vibrio sp. 11986-1-5 TaxID=2211215 RepID=UPI002692F4C3